MLKVNKKGGHERPPNPAAWAGVMPMGTWTMPIGMVRVIPMGIAMGMFGCITTITYVGRVVNISPITLTSFIR